MNRSSDHMAQDWPEPGTSHNLQHGFACQDLREWIAEACRPFHWRDEFHKSTKPNEELLELARKKFSYLLE